MVGEKARRGPHFFLSVEATFSEGSLYNMTQIDLTKEWT
jgi:hypothetical protein